MSYILVIPDVHEKIAKAQTIVDRYQKDADEIIFLGDYFDSFEWDNMPRHWEEVCEWLRVIADHPKVRLILGNHDVHYFGWVDRYICSGFQLRKRRIIEQRLGGAFWQKFEFLVHRTIANQQFLFSHAGIHPNFLNPVADIDSKQFEQIHKRARDLFPTEFDNLLAAGSARGGLARLGGITWLDWDLEFKPIPGLTQIVGHTPHVVPQFRPNGDVDLDTHLNHVVLIDSDTGKIAIHQV